MELAAIMITISVVAIQKGPYKSGVPPTTCLKGGFKRTADLRRETTSYYSISKYCLDKRKGTQRLGRRKMMMIYPSFIIIQEFAPPTLVPISVKKTDSSFLTIKYINQR